mgnify:FL=1
MKIFFKYVKKMGEYYSSPYFSSYSLCASTASKKASFASSAASNANATDCSAYLYHTIVNKV